MKEVLELYVVLSIISEGGGKYNIARLVMIFNDKMTLVKLKRYFILIINTV